MANFLGVFSERKGQLFASLLEHIQISFIALFFAVIIAIPIGIYLTNKKKIAESIIGMSAVLQTIPSLALLGLLIPLFGIGKVPAIIALVAYALLPILRNTYTGINEVDASLKEAATAMGMNTRKRLIESGVTPCDARYDGRRSNSYGLDCWDGNARSAHWGWRVRRHHLTWD